MSSAPPTGYRFLTEENLHIIAENILSTYQIKCSHEGCTRRFHLDSVHAHEVACPHGPCTCMEPGCDFTGPLAALVVHHKSIHLIPVHKFSYSDPKLFQEHVPTPGPPGRRVIGVGQDGAIFILTIGAVGPASIVYSVCVRSASCVWPAYEVRMWAHGLPTASVIMNVKAEASRCASPGAVEVEDLTWFLRVPSRNLVGAGSAKQMHFYVCIDKNDRP